MNEPKRVVVIGGGTTGTGIARDAAERGYEVIVIDRGELGSGTSGNFHGILHSGARYAVNDPVVAAECYQENQRLRSLIPSAITDTGGLFVAMNEVEVAHSRVLLAACEQAGIPTEVLTARQALQAEPELSPEAKLAFTVPDGFIDGVELLRLNRQAAVNAEIPAIILTGHEVSGLEHNGSKITAVLARDTRSGAIDTINCDYVVNAAGVWAGEIAGLAGLNVPIVYDKGTMVILARQYSNAVLNRCRPENDGDLLVPQDGKSIMGTTSRVITDPDDCHATQEEIDLLMSDGADMVPALQHAQILIAYAGVRPLAGKAAVGQTADARTISRAYQVLDHAGDGIDNFVSIVGGKVTLFRRMAEAVVDVLDAKNGR